MKSFKDGANPDVSSYDFPDGLESVTFNNASKQLCFVLVVKYAPETPADEPAEEEKDPTSIESAEAAPAGAVRKLFRDGRIVIVSGDKEFTLSGTPLK